MSNFLINEEGVFAVDPVVGRCLMLTFEDSITPTSFSADQRRVYAHHMQHLHDFLGDRLFMDYIDDVKKRMPQFAP